MSPIALADRGSYHVTLNGDIAGTDNVFSESSGNQDMDAFAQIRPGVMFTYAMPRLIQDLEAEAEVTQYAIHGHTPSFSGRGSYSALLLPGPRSEVILAMNAQTGVLNAITARTEPDQTQVQLQPLGKLDYQSADGSEYSSYQATREVRLSQRLFARASRSDDNLMDPTIITSAEAGGTIGLERQFMVSSLALEGGVSIVRMKRIAPEGAPMGSRLDRQYNPRLRGAYTRDLSRRYSLNLDAGAVYVIPYGTDPYNPTDRERSNGLFPILGAQLSLTDGWGAGVAMVRRDVTPNLLVAQNTVSDIAQVTAAVPLKYRGTVRRRSPKLVAIGTVAAMRTQLIDPITSDIDNSFYIGRIDVGVRYNYTPAISYALRYELMVQSSGTDSFGDNVPGFYRNTLFFSFNVRYPSDVAVQVPKRRENAVRSDRKDLMPVGAEPVIPDLTGDDTDDER